MISSNIFRNYDIRGEYGTELTEEAAYLVARAFTDFAKPQKIAVGADCRLSSPDLKKAVMQGLVDSGVDVLDIGETSTDGLYFATRTYEVQGGIMITASHMPKQFNGLKFVRLNEAGMLAPIGKGVGMEELQALAQAEKFSTPTKIGKVESLYIWDDFVEFTKSFANVKAIKPLKVVMDAGNGMGGMVANKVFADLPLTLTKLYFNADGNFPNHEANPIEEKNRYDWVQSVRDTGADLGVAWDADCDRVYFLDEKGNFINGDFIIAILAINFLKKNSGAGVVYDLRAGRMVEDWIKKTGGKAYMERVGHTYIKKRMQETGAIFGGEVSGHYYFAKNGYMENGFAPALMVMEMLSVSGKKMSELIRELGDYFVSGEINFKVDDVNKTLNNLKNKFSHAKEILEIDGLSFDFGNWRFNVRPSANDPVVRLNLEADGEKLLQEKIKEVSLEIM